MPIPTLYRSAQLSCLQVRWYSFQFLMEELAEEFQEMHVALTAVLIKLPDGIIKLT